MRWISTNFIKLLKNFFQLFKHNKYIMKTSVFNKSLTKHWSEGVVVGRGVMLNYQCGNSKIKFWCDFPCKISNNFLVKGSLPTSLSEQILQALLINDRKATILYWNIHSHKKTKQWPCFLLKALCKLKRSNEICSC